MDRPHHDDTDQRSRSPISILVAPVIATLLCCSLASPQPAQAAARAELYLTAVLELGAQFVPDRWVPIRVELTNRTDREVDGFLSMPVADRAARFVVRQPCRVPARSRVRVSLLGTFPSSEDADERGRKGNALARVDWYSAAGERLAVTDLLGVAQNESPGANAGNALRSTFVLVVGDQSTGVDTAAQPIASGPLASIGSVWTNVTDAPRQRAGYDGFRFVVLSGVSPDALDIAQREALMDHLLVGGVLICPAPNPAWAGNWLDPYWPVQCIARRPTTAVADIKLRAGAIVTQALARRGEVLLRDPHYVHVAFQPVGLGRIAFTSFALDAIDPAKKADDTLWARLLGTDRIDATWESTQLAADHTRHLDAMVGVATAPWWLAASIIAGYLCVAVVAQCTFTGARRPAGFALIVAIALAGAATLAGLSMIGKRNAALAGARLATLNLSPAGGGIYQEELAFVGRDEPSLALTVQNASGAALRPIAADAGRPPAVQSDPFAAPEAGARASVIERVWRETQPVAADVRLHVTGTFGPSGLVLALDNAVGSTIHAPALVWRSTGAVCPLGEIAPGAAADVRPGPGNAPGDFGHVSVVTSEAAKLRAAVLQSVSTPSSTYLADTSEPSPMIAGWLDDSAIPSALRVTPQPTMRSAALLRVPLELHPSDVGRNVRIDGAFVRLAPSEKTMGMPYDEQRHRWLATGTTGRWLVGFLPPKQVGRLRPRRVTLSCDASAPQHTISLRGDQISGGHLSANIAGRRVVEWTRPIDLRRMTFEPTAQDVDGSGHVWLLLSVQGVSAEPAAVPPQWLLRALEMTYDDAEVVEKPNAD